MGRTTATSAPKDCCLRLRLDKVLQNEDFKLLLELDVSRRKVIIVESKTSWKQDQWDNKVNPFDKKEESVTKTQGGGY